MSTIYGQHQAKNRWFHDRDGYHATVRHEDAVEVDTIDFAGDLASGETLASVALEESGVSASSVVNASTVDLTVTGSGGDIVATATTSTGRKLVRRLRYYSPTESSTEDYPSC